MWNTIRYFRTLKKLGNFNGDFKRLFMSEAFPCKEVWARRLDNPILKKVSLNDLFFELDNKHVQSGRIKAIDVDIFVNALNSQEHIDEMEDLVHRLRLTTESCNTLPSTSHGFIRNYLDFGESSELIRVLNDRLNYGIFPDKFCSILLMDHFIKLNDFCSAAKVAVLQMLQEEFFDDLVKLMCLYSCHKFLSAPTEWEKPEEPGPESKDDEEVIVRVKYLRNPYFDDHFDLRDPNHLIGKTFLMISDSLDQSISNDYRLLGLILRNDPKAENFLTEILKEKKPLHLNTVELAETIIGQQNDKSEAAEGENRGNNESLKKCLQLLKQENNCSSENIIDVLETKIKKLVSTNEKSLIEEQIQIYEEWENKREEVLKAELDRLNKKLILEQIEEKKAELKKKEDELFFFEREEELDLIIEKKRFPTPSETDQKKFKGEGDEDYIPPEITKQKNKKTA